MFNSKFSKEIVKARKREDYTQQAVAEAISVSVRWYQQIESGEKRPSAIVMMRLLVLFNIDAELFREEVGIIDLYSLVKEENETKNLGKYNSFGIRIVNVCSGEEIDYISDVCTDRANAERIAQLCTESNLAPEHIYDVIADML